MPEENTLRDDLEAAVAEAEKDLLEPETVEAAPAEEPEEAPPEPEATEEPERAPRRRNAKGQFLADEAHPDDVEKYPNLTDERTAKAPESWRPQAREGWDELPDHVKREAHRREYDIQTGQQAAAAHRDLAERFERTVAPYAPLIAAQGASDPVEAIGGLLQTAAVLQTGTQQQKAERLADIISAYGVEIGTLDDVLTGRAAGEPTQQSEEARIQALVDARVKPLEERLAGVQDQSQEHTRRTIDEFSQQAEFLDDVRMDMADLIDLASARGRKLSLQQAYDTACRMNPEISRVLESRKTAPKQALADSVLNGRQSGVEPPPASDGSIRSDIEAALRTLEDR
jgi:hypothetical protein